MELTSFAVDVVKRRDEYEFAEHQAELFERLLRYFDSNVRSNSDDIGGVDAHKSPVRLWRVLYSGGTASRWTA